RSVTVDENSFDMLLKLRLAKVMEVVGLSFEKLRQIILSVNILFILDGQDESTQNDLLNDILKYVNTPNGIRLIITTRPTASLDLQQNILSSFTLPKLDLELIGISLENQITFITKYVKVMEQDAGKQDDLLLKIDEELPGLNSSLGEIMMSPLMLSLLTLLWVTEQIVDSLTVTEVFTKVNDILKAKLISRLLKKRCGPNLEAKLNSFQEYLQHVAFQNFSDNEIIFTEKTTVQLKEKCRECGLADVEDNIFEHHFTSRKSRKNLVPVVTYSYRHLRLQEFDSSQHVIRVLLGTGNDLDKEEIMKQLQGDRFNNIRAHILAIMADSHPQLLTQYGKAIVDCVKPG
ncbi:unnamed protein product, partial [Meganyctiphanes norvegica]